MRALIITSDLFEDGELLEPLCQLRAKGVQVDVAAPQKRPIIGKHGHKVDVELSLAAVRPEEYDLLILPGGKAPSKLRTDAMAVAVAEHFLRAGKPIAAICHGPQILLATGLLKGRRATSYRTMRQEMAAAGVHYRDSEVVVDKNLITSRRPADIPAFMRAIFRIVVQSHSGSRAGVREDHPVAAAPAGIDVIDEAELESFPASDPPSWIDLHIGAPSHAPVAKARTRHG